MYASLAQFKPCDLPDLPDLLSSLQSIAPLLDTLSDVVFFIKDCQARYAFVNQTLARRCGVKHSSELLGHTAEMVFPRRFGPLYTSRTAGCWPVAESWPTSLNCICITPTNQSGA